MVEVKEEKKNLQNSECIFQPVVICNDDNTQRKAKQAIKTTAANSTFAN